MGKSDLKKASLVREWESEVLDTDSKEPNLISRKKSGKKEFPQTAALWSMSRLRQRRVPVPQEDLSSELIASDSEDNEYNIGAAAQQSSSSQYISCDSEE